MLTLKQEQVARMLGVTRVRVTQLVGEGKLPRELTPEAVEEYRTSREKDKATREAWKKAQAEKHEAERREMLDALDRINRNVLLLAAALGAKGIADTILR